MATTKVPRKPPKKALLPLASLTIRRVEDFSGKPIPRTEQTKVPADDIALALDFLERLQWRRMAEEGQAWLDAQTIADRLHAVRGLIHLRQELVGREDKLAVSEEEWDAFIADVLEYFTIRAELAGDKDFPRGRLYKVTVDASNLLGWPPRAVAPGREVFAKWAEGKQ